MKTKNYPGTLSNEVSERERRHMQVARHAAAEGIVLLENDGVLPLQKGAAIAVYGGGALYTIKGGTGSGSVNNRSTVSIFQGLKDAGLSIVTEDWLEEYAKRYEKAREDWKQAIYAEAGDTHDFSKLYRAHATRPMEMPQGSEVVKKDTEIAIYVISRTAGEGADRKADKGDYYLTDSEWDELKQITAQYAQTVVILNVGGVIDLSFMDELPISALVLLSQPGMEGGHALADVLTGEVNPSGRLTDTWAKHYMDYPSSPTFSHNNGNIIEEKYTDDIYVGYRYFDTFGVTPRYPIGFGRSYTTFSIRPAEVQIRENKVSVTLTVSNTGAKAGREAMQLYAFCPQTDPRGRELRRMVAFAKTGLLPPGESETLELNFPVGLLASYHTARSEYCVEAGAYPLVAEWCDASGHMQQIFPCVLTVSQTKTIEKLTPICPLLDALKEIRPKAPQSPEPQDAPRIALDEAVDSEIRLRQQEKENVWENPLQNRAEEILDGLSTEQKARLVCGRPSLRSGEIIGGAAVHVPGAAGETTDCIADLGIGALVLADGPAGLRLQQHYQVNPEDGSIYMMDMYQSLENRIFGKEYLHEGGESHYQFCTAIPVGTLLAQSYDTELLEEVGRMIGVEMQELGIHLWLAPGMNIHRNPLCGRNFEYYSEDPLISGKMAAAITRGVQSLPGCGVTIKHFACNNQEENRRGVSSIVSERALREIYLKGFEIAIREANPKAIMTSYNKVNGVHTANSYDLCTTAAREEWGFQGIIMTDWLTTNQEGGSAAAKCITAGNDLIMPGNRSDIAEIMDAVDQKYDLALSMEELDRCAARMLCMILELRGE